MLPAIQKCHSCKASIFWVRTAASNALMPVDAQACADGNIVVADEVAHVLAGDMFETVPEGERFKSHFATCPHARQHRKRK